MKKKVPALVLVFTFAIFSCAANTVQRVEPAVPVPAGLKRPAFFDTTPQNNELIVIGVAGVSFNTKNAIRAALQDAARRVAFFYAVGGEIVYHESSGPLVGNTSVGKKVLAPAGEYGMYSGDLQFTPETDVLVTNRAVFVRARYALPQSLHIDYVYPPGNVKPSWIDNPPEKISGYPAGVGFAGSRLKYKDTIIDSYEDAVFAILESELITMDVIESESGKDINTSSLSYTAGTVYGFYILDTWTDPETRAVWTLAIAKNCKMGFSQ
jgi:hypothetical protein